MGKRLCPLTLMAGCFQSLTAITSQNLSIFGEAGPPQVPNNKQGLCVLWERPGEEGEEAFCTLRWRTLWRFDGPPAPPFFPDYTVFPQLFPLAPEPSASSIFLT